jgi:hypothetical protein
LLLNTTTPEKSTVRQRASNSEAATLTQHRPMLQSSRTGRGTAAECRRQRVADLRSIEEKPRGFRGFSRVLLLMKDLIANTADLRGMFVSDPIMTLAVSEAVAEKKSDDKINVVGVGSD